MDTYRRQIRAERKWAHDLLRPYRRHVQGFKDLGHPFEVEQALMAHPEVLEAAVVAHRDEDDLEKPRAFVVLKEGRDTEVVAGLKDFVKERIGKCKYPRWVDVIDELPKIAVGKIQRFRLRENL